MYVHADMKVVAYCSN